MPYYYKILKQVQDDILRFDFLPNRTKKYNKKVHNNYKENKKLKKPSVEGFKKRAWRDSNPRPFGS